jgi:hypothetical protein
MPHPVTPDFPTPKLAESNIPVKALGFVGFGFGRLRAYEHADHPPRLPLQSAGSTFTNTAMGERAGDRPELETLHERRSGVSSSVCAWLAHPPSTGRVIREE